MSKQQNVGPLITRLREAKKLTKAELARRAGVSAPYLSQIESGDRAPSEAVLRQLAGALGIENFRLLEPAGYQFTGEGYFENYDRAIAEVRDYLESHSYDMSLYFDGIIKAIPDLALWTASGPTQPAGPEGWDELDAADQKLVQSLIRRLLGSTDEDSEAPQAATGA